MPEALITLLPALITAGTAGVTTGLQAAGTFQPSTTAATKQAEQDQLQQQQKQQQSQEQQLFKHFAPDAQGQTGGALSDQSLSAMIAELSGAPGDINLAQQTVFGTGPAGTASPLPIGG